MPASRRSAVRIAFALAASTLFAGAAFAQKTQLLVYTALETDQLKAYQEGFNKVHPDIDLKWVRDSTGVITAKLLAEKAKGQGIKSVVFDRAGYRYHGRVKAVADGAREGGLEF